MECSATNGLPRSYSFLGTKNHWRESARKVVRPMGWENQSKSVVFGHEDWARSLLVSSSVFLGNVTSKPVVAEVLVVALVEGRESIPKGKHLLSTYERPQHCK